MQRKLIILNAAVHIVREYGNFALSHASVAEFAGIEIETSEATVRRYFGSWNDLAVSTAAHRGCPKSFRDYVEGLEL